MEVERHWEADDPAEVYAEYLQCLEKRGFKVGQAILNLCGHTWSVDQSNCILYDNTSDPELKAVMVSSYDEDSEEPGFWMCFGPELFASATRQLAIEDENGKAYVYYADYHRTVAPEPEVVEHWYKMTLYDLDTPES